MEEDIGLKLEAITAAAEGVCVCFGGDIRCNAMFTVLLFRLSLQVATVSKGILVEETAIIFTRRGQQKPAEGVLFQSQQDFVYNITKLSLQTLQVISQLTSLEVARASKETSISDLRGCYHSPNSQKQQHHRFTTYIAYKLEYGVVVVVVVQACMHYVPKCVFLWSDFFVWTKGKSIFKTDMKL